MPFRALTSEQVTNHIQRVHDAQEGAHLSDMLIDNQLYPDVLSALDSHERRLASPDRSYDGYLQGVAIQEDQIHPGIGIADVMVSTEHATAHWRHRTNGTTRFKEAETGLAGLGALLNEDIGATHLSMLGRQTSDPNYDPDHRYKAYAARLAQQGYAATFVSVHGMHSHHVSSLDDERSFDLVVGVGASPSPATAKLGDHIVATARQYGLRAGINEQFLRITQRGDDYFVETNEQGEYKTVSFRAASPRTVRSVIETAMSDAEVPVGCVQVELARTLRLVQSEVSRGEVADQLGPYLGYMVLAQALRSFR